MTTAEEIVQILNSNYHEAISIECGVAMSVQAGRSYFEPAIKVKSARHDNKVIELEATYKDGSMIRYTVKNGYEVAQPVY